MLSFLGILLGNRVSTFEGHVGMLGNKENEAVDQERPLAGTAVVVAVFVSCNERTTCAMAQRSTRGVADAEAIAITFLRCQEQRGAEDEYCFTIRIIAVPLLSLSVAHQCQFLQLSASLAPSFPAFAMASSSSSSSPSVPSSSPSSMLEFQVYPVESHAYWSDDQIVAAEGEVKKFNSIRSGL